MLRIGVVNEETWGFFEEIYGVLKGAYHTSVFRRRETRSPVFYDRINRFYLKRDMQSFMQANDVVFFEWASHLLVFASQLPKRCRIVTRLHRYEMYKWVELVNWDNVDKVILVSEAKRRSFVDKFPEHADKATVISGATSLDKFQYSPKAYAGDIGTLCHLTPRKRVYDLILTFAELCEEGEDLHLHIGGGEHHAQQAYFEAMQHLVQGLGLAQRVTFYGKVAEPWNWYPNIDIFVSNSYSEGLQVAPMEAMASGCFCLSHHWDGAGELLPSEQLFFTGSQLKQLIRRHIHRSEQERVALRRQMREMACNRFDMRKTIARIQEIIEEVNADGASQ